MILPDFRKYLPKNGPIDPEKTNTLIEKQNPKHSILYYICIFLTVLLVLAIGWIVALSRQVKKNVAVYESKEKEFDKYISDKNHQVELSSKSADSLFARYQEALRSERRWRDSQDVYRKKQLNLSKQRHESDSVIERAPTSEHYKFFSEYARKSGFGAEFDALNP